MRLSAILLVALTAPVARAQTPVGPAPSPTPATPPGVVVPSTPAPSSPLQPRPTPSAPPPSTPAPPGKAPSAQAAPAPATTAPPSTSAPSSNDLDFNLFGNEQQKSPVDQAREKERLAKLERKVHLRRKLLTWHQALGFVTLAALAATDIVGQLNYDDKYLRSGTDTGQFATAHEGLGIGTTVLFGVTGILALSAPNPYPKPIKLDAALLHKVSMALAAACFTAQVILGPITAVSDGKLYQRDLALAHVVTGYGAFAFMGIGTLAYVF